MSKANVWLEKKLTENDNLCADWLWLHNRWKGAIVAPKEELDFEAEKALLSSPKSLS
jgi:hypothetical protein